MKTRTKEMLKAKMYKMFTVDQIDAYWLIHPDLEGLSYKKAAECLGITEQSLRERLKRMKETYPYAFRFEGREGRELLSYRNLNKVYGGYQAKAKEWKVPFKLTQEELYEIITLPCEVCMAEPTKPGVKDDGSIFGYNYLGLRKLPEGFTYINTIPLCYKHSRGRCK